MEYKLWLCILSYCFFVSFSSEIFATRVGSFREIQHEFKPLARRWEVIIQTESANKGRQSDSKPKISSLEMFKLKARQIFMRQVDICYRRFQRCSQQLSAAFCASSTKNITFYLWARNVADDIMNGHGNNDKAYDVKCSPALLRKFLNNSSHI